MKKLSLTLALILSMSTPAITCNIDAQTTFTAFNTENESGFFMERMQTDILNYNDIVRTIRKPVHIPILNVKATQVTHIGSMGAKFSYLSLNRKIYQPVLEIEGEEIELFQCR